MKQWRVFSWILILPVVWLTGCSDKIEPGNTAAGESPTVKAPVAVAEVTQEPFLYEAVGTITARTASTISGKLMGTVLKVHVREGDLVKEGDELVTLDPRQVSAQLDKAKAGLREARRAEASAVSAHESAAAAAKLAEATYKRYQQLLKENSASQQEFEEVEARHRQAQATLAQTDAMVAAAQSRVQQAEAAVRSATIGKKDAVVTAPYDGRVVTKMITEGDLASPGTPFLTIEQEGLYWAELVLPERHIQSVKEGDTVKVAVPALDNLEVAGTVGRIIPMADARSRSFQVKVTMPEGLDLKSGMFARVFVPVGGTGMLLIPRTAIAQEGQLDKVFILDDDNNARLRLIRTGKTYGDRVEIVSGLNPGQRYVMALASGIRAGVQVEGHE
jgi:multidrug efflux pump subunit AcrA (membrane-fusion protein)